MTPSFLKGMYEALAEVLARRRIAHIYVDHFKMFLGALKKPTNMAKEYI